MIYLDHNATTPLAPEVREVMLPYLAEEWGNPSSSYRFGAKLKGVIETARGQVAELIGASPREIVFTSGATEANNTALHAALKAHPARRHIVTSAVEHSSVLSCCRALEREGARVTILPVDREGLLKLAELATSRFAGWSRRRCCSCSIKLECARRRGLPVWRIRTSRRTWCGR